jgi:hypothetical protein
MIYKALHRKLKIDQHEPNKKSGVISGAPERQAVLAPPVTPIVLYCPVHLSHSIFIVIIEVQSFITFQIAIYFCWHSINNGISLVNMRCSEFAW